MKNKGKTKAQLLQEMAEMGLRIAQLKKSEAKRMEVETALRESEKRYFYDQITG